MTEKKEETPEQPFLQKKVGEKPESPEEYLERVTMIDDRRDKIVFAKRAFEAVAMARKQEQARYWSMDEKSLSIQQKRDILLTSPTVKELIAEAKEHGKETGYAEFNLKSESIIEKARAEEKERQTNLCVEIVNTNIKATVEEWQKKVVDAYEKGKQDAKKSFLSNELPCHWLNILRAKQEFIDSINQKHFEWFEKEISERIRQKTAREIFEILEASSQSEYYPIYQKSVFNNIKARYLSGKAGEAQKSISNTSSMTDAVSPAPVNIDGGLWLTSGKRIVLDSYNNEAFAPPYDKKIMTAKELTSGIPFQEFLNRLAKGQQEMTEKQEETK